MRLIGGPCYSDVSARAPRVLVFLTLVRLGLKRMVRYPWGILVSLAIDPIVLLLTIQVFTSIYRHAGATEVMSYSLNQMIWYFAATTFIWYWIFNFVDRRIAERIVRGDLSQDLLRPVSVFTWELGFAASLRVAGVLLEFIPSLVLYSLLVPPAFLTATGALRFVLAACLAFLLFFTINFLIGLAGVYLQNPHSLLAVKHIVIATAAGAFIPLDFFPDSVARVLQLLPFSYLFYWPIQFFLARAEHTTWSAFVGREVVAVAWLVVLFGLCRLLWGRAVRRYADAGG